ncbi:PKD domain-containing protein [Chitinophaga sp. GCM10012297]|uniref:PKD domain-containing protein n=1 Tax=Chitinophaga chungangae TaxID=2821488 RepID=A0ABS3Y9U7_9BACT|nr:gliding motility-associated C-terminal domain-containing protein [Chitinophaga chungangae]MBO9151406.1 PKD domain-containing protein [Chitinophaga chungangae]
MNTPLPRAFIRRALLCITCVLSFRHYVSAQHLSNTGTDFWVGYGHHQFMEPGMGNSQEMVLYISAGQAAANVTVSIHGTAWVRNYSIPANTSITTETIPKAGFYDARLYSPPPSFGGTGGEGIFANKAIHIESDVPVVVNTHIYGSASSGASMLIPSNAWGYEYISLNSQQYYQDNAFSWMFVIAKEDNTVIEITPSKPSRNGRVPGVPFTVTLHKGNIYQVLGAALGGGYGNDLTGTKVRSIPDVDGVCHPIAAFSGSSRTYIACPGGSPGGGDNIIQQLFPKHTWGRRYLTAPFSNENGAGNLKTDMFRVIVSDPATVVKRNGSTLGGLIDNVYYEFQSNTADLIEADKPVMMAQYMSSSNGCANTLGGGDPEMIYLSPLGQGVKRTVFYRTTHESMNIQYVTLILPDAGLASLQIDGAAGVDHVYAHPQMPGYSVAVKRYAAANATGSITCDQPFTGVTYGLGSVESYGYNIGLNLENLNGTGRIKNSESTDESSEFTCLGTPVKLSVLLPYQPTVLNWKISALGSAVSPNADVLQNMPPAADTLRIDGILYYQYILPQDYTFNTGGDYTVPVEATHPSITMCGHTETINIPVEVRAGPQAMAAFTTPTACTLDTVYFSAGETNGAFTFDRWAWTFPDGSTAGTREAKKIFQPGTHKIKLRAVTTMGCASLDSVSFTIHDRPTASFSSSTAAVCEGGLITFEDNGSAYAGTAPVSARYWDFGNGASPVNSANTSEQAAYASYGTYEAKMVAKVSDLCVSDTAHVSVAIHAKPIIEFITPGDCLPADRSARFTNNTTAPGGQTIAGYQWDFGDGSGVSTDKDPVYQYTSDGTYTVQYTATTNNGCVSDSSFNIDVSAKPELRYSVVPPVCENVPGPSTVALAGVQNGVTGTGIYSGPGIEDSGALQPGIAGVGDHTAKYIFTTTAGCIDSISAPFTIRAKPDISLTLPEGCMPVNGEAAFSSNATTSDGQAVNGYLWNFGDGSANSADQNPVHHYTAPGTFNVTYSATTVNGCTSDTSVQVKLSMLPDLAYSVIPPVCVSAQGPVSVATASVENNLTGSGIYSGEGVSTNGNFAPAVAGVGTHAVKYIFTTTDGCVDSASSDITVNALPVAGFVASSDSVCQGGSLSFTDMSTGGMAAWNWNFGDGGNASAANPDHRFNRAGTFSVSLRVTDVHGCISEPFSLPVVATVLPVIDAGPSFTVREGTRIQFQPTANDSTQVTFRWSPAGEFTDPNVLRATLTATQDAVYTLTAQSGSSCSATDQVTVTVIKAIKPPNVFSPNGDNINDTWVIRELVNYPNCIVEIFNRYGQRLYRSAGYGTSWDGKYRGDTLPVGTYYYVIQPGDGGKSVSGSVTILK